MADLHVSFEQHSLLNILMVATRCVWHSLLNCQTFSCNFFVLWLISAIHVEGVTTSGEILIKLAQREDEEKEYMMKILKNSSSDKIEIERMQLYASLHLQCIRIEQHGSFEYAAISGCLAERKQNEDFDK